MSERIKQKADVDMVRLRGMLDRVLKTSDGRAPSKAEETRILDIACGACTEADLLTDFFADLRGGDAKLTGIDMRAREIADASRRLGKGGLIDPHADTRKSFEFLTGDATKLSDHAELGDDFDVVFMRHQNFWNGERVWEEIFDEALKKLGPDGKLIITSYFDREHELALNALQGLGGELITTAQNELSRDLPTDGKSVDRHVAVFRRKR